MTFRPAASKKRDEGIASPAGYCFHWRVLAIHA